MSKGKNQQDKPVVLLTRPQADCQKIIPDIEKKGYTVVCAPMMEIIPLHPRLPSLEDYDGILFTSANGVRATTAHISNKNIHAYAVGPATAEALEEAGYSNITTGPGNVEGLIDHIQKTVPPTADTKQVRILYLSGTHISQEPACKDIDITRIPVYKAQGRADLPPDVLDILDHTPPAYALFYSSRTAKLFKDALKKTGRTGQTKATKALCIAPSVIKSLYGTDWADIQAATQADTPHMLDLLPYANADTPTTP